MVPDGIVVALSLCACVVCAYNTKNIADYCSERCDAITCPRIAPEKAPEIPHMERL